jgi:hypothetical protein
MARRLEMWLSGSVLALGLLYWLAWCLVAPVTNGDSQVYNLARLWVIDRDGLFFNRSYTWTPQLIMPWSFDAVHYPFVRLGYGYALPSFLCLLGIMAILFTWARERGDAADGLRACVGLLAMPMVVMQATTTKNDLVVAFCLVCWIEALRRHAGRPTRGTVLLAALALTFVAGSKLTGLLYAGAAVAVSLWFLRRRPSDVAWFMGGGAVMFALIGSLEIYVNNLLQFGDWRGDPLLYQYNSNRDGWRGFLANELRYAASVFDLQLLPPDLLHRIALLKFRVCQRLLEALHLQGLGFMSLPWRPTNDSSLLRLMAARDGTESRSTYGIIGALLITAGPVVVAARRRLDFPAALFLAGVAAHVLLALRLGWDPANLRYFVAAACLAWAGMSLLVISARHRGVALGFTVLVAACAVLVPFSVTRSPAQLAVAFHDRDALLPDFTRQMIARAKTWKRDGELPVILTARRLPVFHLYDQLAPNLISIPNLSEEDLVRVDDVYHRGTYRIVAMKVKLDLPGVVCEEALEAYETRICVWRRG